MRKKHLFKISVFSFYTQTQKDFSENFDSEKNAMEFCQSKYKFYLWVKLNGKLIIDNTRNFKKTNNGETIQSIKRQH